MLTPALDSLTALELTPLELVEMAAKNGYTSVGMMVQGSSYLPFPGSGLLDGAGPRTELRNRCRDLGVKIDTIEVFVLDKHCDPQSFRPALETSAFLEAGAVNTLPFDRNVDRLGDTYGKFQELADEYGFTVFTEVHRNFTHNSITSAVEFFDKLGLDVKVELDSLHFFRYGGQIEELARHRDRIGRAQLCDGPAQATDAEYLMEALYNRQMPGDGALQLVEFLANLPDGIVVGLEVPRPEYRTAERISRTMDAFRAVAAQAGRA